MMRRQIAAGLTALSALGLFGVPGVATAASTPSLTVHHNVYLVQAPQVGSTRLALERAGSTLTVEPGGSSYWWHVKDANGHDGYVTTGSYYVTTPSNLDLKVTHPAYLIAAPVQGTGRIALETSGSLVTVEPGGNAYWWHVKDASGNDGYITTSAYYSTPVANVTTIPYPPAPAQHINAAPFALPPGVRIDTSIKPIARTGASNEAKFKSILQVAASKLGIPYVWGHNEDRGQVGFDCSNFVEYVYHHALGYSFSTSSTQQFTSVGTTIPTAEMQPGDLLAFDKGAHTGIYIGNGWMVQCGGGLKEVGYLYIGPGTYWAAHLSAVKRMY